MTEVPEKVDGVFLGSEEHRHRAPGDARIAKNPPRKLLNDLIGLIAIVQGGTEHFGAEPLWALFAMPFP